MSKPINILFLPDERDPSRSYPLVFVEVEDDEGVALKVGEWIEKDGYTVLRITELPEN